MLKEIAAVPTPVVDFRGYYGSEAFDPSVDPSWGSAKAIAPLVAEMFQPKTVIDVGCGVGAWLQAFGDLGVGDLTGVDGDYIDPKRLLMPAGQFVPHDLRLSLPALGRFDLAVCVEVAEHLPRERSADFVRDLTSLAPVVLFSAAIPLQGGLGHVNEREAADWIDLFGRHGYVMFDAIRPMIWCDDRVAWWYRQNLVLFLSSGVVARYPQLERYRDRPGKDRLLVIHEGVYRHQQAYAASLSQVLRALPRAFVGIPDASPAEVTRVRSIS